VRDQFGLEVSLSTIDRGIDSFRYSLKRIQNIAIAADTPENDVRIEFAIWYIQMTLEGRTMINDDKTGFNLSMREAQGRSKIGVRAQTRVPAIRSRNINVMAATHSRAMTYYQILEGNSNAESFSHFIDDLTAQKE
jgi:hypothetical protein